jgi:hypothetical protein
VYGKRLKVMIPTSLPALEDHGRLKLGKGDRDLVLAISAATIDRALGDVNIAASGGKWRRGASTRRRREVPIRLTRLSFMRWSAGRCDQHNRFPRQRTTGKANAKILLATGAGLRSL